AQTVPFAVLALARYTGPLTPSQAFVTHLYNDLLGRAPDPGGLALFTTILDRNTVPRDAVVRFFLGSLEYRTRTVQDLYRRFLQREADPVGLNGWVAFLGQGGSAGQIAA